MKSSGLGGGNGAGTEEGGTACLVQAVAGKQTLSGWRLYAGSTPPIAAATIMIASPMSEGIMSFRRP